MSVVWEKDARKGIGPKRAALTNRLLMGMVYGPMRNWFDGGKIMLSTASLGIHI